MRFLAALFLCLLAFASPVSARCWKPGQTASWYSGVNMATGDYSYVDGGCASRTHKKGTKLKVTDIATGRSAKCVVNDYGPAQWTGCQIDVDRHVAKKLRMKERGVIRARIEKAEYIGSRPSGCPSRAWCGCWLAQHLGMASRALWLAANWAHIGTAASGPAPGVIAVWPHHVGVVTAVTGPHRIVLLSGNDGHRVRERERSTAGVIAWRRLSYAALQ